jgi:hypothetical protein
MIPLKVERTLFSGFGDTLSVIRVDHEDDTLSVLEVYHQVTLARQGRTMPPQRTNLVLSSNIPHCERDVLVLDGFDIETLTISIHRGR